MRLVEFYSIKYFVFLHLDYKSYFYEEATAKNFSQNRHFLVKI